MAQNFKSYLYLAVIVIIVLLVIFLRITLKKSYEQSIRAAHQNATNITHLVSKQASDTFKNIDLILQEVDNKIQHASPADIGSHSSISELMRQRLKDANYIRAFFAIGADGYIIHDTDHTTLDVSLADREYFRFHLSESAPQLHIGKPVVSRSLGTLFVSLSRRISTPDGSFAGIITAALELDYMEKFYEGLAIGENDLVYLWNDDGILLASWPKFEKQIDKNILTFNVEKIGVDKDFLSSFDNRKKIVSSAKLQNYPISVSVEIDQENVRSLWLKKIQPAIILFAILVAVIIVFTWFLQRYLQKLKSYEKNLQIKNSQLEQSEHKFRSLFQHSPDAMFLTASDASVPASDSTVAACNQTACSMFSRTEEEICRLGRSGLLDVTDPRIQQALDERQRKGFIHAFEVTAVRGNGEKFPVEIDSVLLNEGPVGAFVIMRDLTERKQAEKERLELEVQLRQKFKMEAVGTIAGGIAHNFNNNLSVILGNVELSQLKINNPEINELLQNAKIGINRSRDLVSQIMTYSRKGATSMAPLQLSLIIDETFKLLESTIPSTIQLNQTISPDSYSATINADASQIQEILLNLYNNAVHAMDENGELSISLDVVDLTGKDLSNSAQLNPGHYAKITIKDTGCGMTTATQEKIFDPFFTTKEMHEGTGMGLSTVYGIVEQHGGLIEVESTVGQGTTFELYFPVIETTQTAQPTPVKAEIPRGSEQILFVDDDEMLAKLGEMLLTEIGYQVTTITDSSKALKLFAANADHIDLVITDQTMPQLTGKELIQELLKIRPDIPTIICTGYSSKLSEEEASELGASAFMMKPLDLQELAQTVRRVLDEGETK